MSAFDTFAVVFSSRSRWDRSLNPIARALEQARVDGRPILDLTESNPTRCGFTYPGDEIRAALGDPRGLVYEPEPRGLLDAREAVASYYADLGATVEVDNILLVAGTSEAYSFLFRLLADPGDEILVPAPSYPLFGFLSELDDVRTVPYTLGYDGAWHVDLASVRAALTPKTRAIIVVSPHNPTGMQLRRAELGALESVAAEHGLAIICDEVFADYAFGFDPERVRTTAGDRTALAFTLSGLSKIVGLPQLKLGWICVNGPDAARREALERLEIIADSYLSVNTPVQLAAKSLLAGRKLIQTQIRERIATNRGHLVDAARGHAWEPLRTDGGWYAVLRVPQRASEEEWVLALLREQGVLVHPGYFFDFPTSGYLAISLLPTVESFRHGLARIGRVIEETTP
jgi:alanine-synthesizing transaminase